MLIAERRSYGNSLANMGFTHHNIIRFRRYDSNISNVNKLVKDEYSIYNDLSNDKLNFKQVAVDKSSNHVHFAFSGKRLSKNSLASYMRINRKYLRDTKSLTDSMGYFTKHVGKSLSYHNLYT